jgi:DNA-binding NarL/FixJ family response regulator
VILDFAMPEMHGLDAATAIKFILPRARIYLLTAHSSRDLELAARNGGVDAVFSKYDNLTAMFKQAKVGRIFKTPTKATRSPRASNAVPTPLPTAKAAFIEPA